MTGITVIASYQLNDDYNCQLWKEAVLKNNIIFLRDVFDNNDVIRLIKEYGAPAFIVNDHLVLNLEMHNVSIFYFLGCLEKLIKNFKSVPLVTDPITTHCFNFCINKKQVNRYLLIRLVEYFKLTSFSYTYSGNGRLIDDSILIDEMKHADLPVHFKETICSEILLPTNFIKPPTAYENNGSHIGNFGGIVWAWNNGLKDMYSTSAVSLIAESIKYDKSITFTEKTVYAMLGLTFPLWIGGYAQADTWKRVGFDTFDDIIDHSYQYKNTLIERCYYAIKNNLKILTDLTYASNLRSANLDRLLKNQTLILSDHLTTYNNSLATPVLVSPNTSMLDVINHDRNNTLLYVNRHYEIV
jgi:hypothetical protein